MFSLFIFFGMLVILLSLKTELFSISFIQRTDGNKRFILFFSGLLLFFSGLYLYFSEPDNYAECLKNELKGVNSGAESIAVIDFCKQKFPVILEKKPSDNESAVIHMNLPDSELKNIVLKEVRFGKQIKSGFSKRFVRSEVFNKTSSWYIKGIKILLVDENNGFSHEVSLG